MAKFSWGGIHPLFLNPILSAFTPYELKGKTILDCGCGKGTNGYLIRATRDLRSSTIIGLDTNQEYLAFCKSYKIYDVLVKHKLPSLPFKDKSVDFLICTEVIEHFPRKDGEKLLSEIDRVCKGRALISTPNVYFETLPNEEEDSHKSIWGVEDFRERGYKVHGIGFKTPLTSKGFAQSIKYVLYYVFTPLSFIIPEIGGDLICVKDY